MKIEFQRTIIENFCSFEHAVFDFAKCGPGLHYVYGENRRTPSLDSNGSGKSSLFHAMSWCQFGHTADEEPRVAVDIRPRHWKGPTKVTNVFLVDGKKTEITRSTNPTNLTMNGKGCTQAQIDDLIGFPLFSSTLLIGQGQPLFFDMRPAAKMELFTNGLTLNRWDARSAHAKESARRAGFKKDMAEETLAHWKTIKQQLDGTIADLQDKMTVWGDEQEYRLEHNRKELKKAEAELEKQIGLRDEADLRHDSAATELKAVRFENMEIETRLGNLNKNNELIKDKIKGARNAIKWLEDSLGTIEDADVCPTCSQSITGSELSKHRRELKQQIKGNKADIVKLEKRLLTAEIEEICQRRIDLRKQEKKFEEKADNARAALDRLIPAVANAEANIKVLKGQIEADENQVNPYQEQVKSNKRQRAETIATIREIEDDIVKLQGRIERCNFWVKGFKDIRLYIIEEVLRELEDVTNNMIEEVGLVDYAVRYEVERETQAGTIQRGLNVLIQGPDDDKAVKWKCWSKGEGQRLRLIGAMSLSDVLLAHAGIETNLEIYDEPTVHMTGGGIDSLCELLAQRAEITGKTIFFIDHKAVESSHFTSTIKVVKSKDGRSKLVI